MLKISSKSLLKNRSLLPGLVLIIIGKAGNLVRKENLNFYEQRITQSYLIRKIRRRSNFETESTH